MSGYIQWVNIIALFGTSRKSLKKCRKNQEKDICADMPLYVPIRPSVFPAFDQRQKVSISFISPGKPHPTCQWDK